MTRLPTDGPTSFEAELLAQLSETLPDAFWVRDLTANRILFVSAGFEEIWGIDREKLDTNSMAWLDAIHPEDRERVRAQLVDAPGGHAQYRVVRPDGSVRWVHGGAFALYDATGAVYRKIGIATDISTQKAAQAAIEEALHTQEEARSEAETARIRAEELGRVKTELLSRVSHQLRTRLTSIIGFSHTVRRADLSPERVEQYLGRIAANADQLQHMLADLLDLDRTDRRALQPLLEPTDVRALVTEVVAGLELSRRRPTQLTADPIVCRVDASQVGRILENVLSNVLRYTPPDTPVWIHTYSDADTLVLRVDDAGPGIPPDVRAAGFEPFASSELGDPNPGLGVGLALVHRFAALHGGSVSIGDRAGGGATVEIRIPRCVVRAEDLAPSYESHAVPLPRPLVLAIADDPQICAMVQRILSRAGTSCVTASGGSEGFLRARDLRPDVILLDLTMIGLSGTAVLTRLRADPRTTGIAVICLTGEGGPIVEAQHLLLGADDYLVKPFEPDELTSKISGALQRRASGRTA